MLTKISKMSSLLKIIATEDIPKSVFFFDIDNTTMRIQSDICSSEWVHWQIDLHKKSIQSRYKIGNSIEDVYAHYRQIMLRHDFDHIYVEESTPSILDDIIKMNGKIIFLTARNKLLADTTIKYLKKNYSENIFQSDINHDADDIIFRNNTIFASGKNKAACIDYYNNNIANIPSDHNIYLIDDSDYEITRAKQLIDKKNISNIHLIHYTYADKFAHEFNSLDKDYLHNKFINLIN